MQRMIEKSLRQQQLQQQQLQQQQNASSQRRRGFLEKMPSVVSDESRETDDYARYVHAL